MLQTIWNLFLAFLPVAVARPLVRRLRAPRALTVPTAALALAWVLLLPNAPYLLTEIRHFVLDSPWRDITARAAHDPAALRASAGWGLLFVLYGAVGVVAFTLAVRPVEQAVRARGIHVPLWRVGFYPLMALGVWLGLIPRFNSWDALLHPGDVVGAALWALTHLPTAASIAAFAAVLGSLHVLLDAAWTGSRRRPPALALTPSEGRTTP